MGERENEGAQCRPLTHSPIRSCHPQSLAQTGAVSAVRRLVCQPVPHPSGRDVDRGLRVSAPNRPVAFWGAMCLAHADQRLALGRKQAEVDRLRM